MRGEHKDPGGAGLAGGEWELSAPECPLSLGAPTPGGRSTKAPTSAAAQQPSKEAETLGTHGSEQLERQSLYSLAKE